MTNTPAPEAPDLGSDLGPDLGRTLEATAETLTKAKAEIGKSIFGLEDVIDLTLITLLSGGHGLLVGLPGLAKTRLVETISTVMGLDSKRVQFTPDLMPKDIVGAEILEETEGGKRAFRFVKGPLFCQLLMADEINRASPRTQSALLQAMQEHEVSIAGERLALPEPFHVLATQNPIEQEGTYPLPEAQLDRFFMQIDVTYPDEAAERQMLLATTGTEEAVSQKVWQGDDLLKAQKLVRQMPIGDSVVDGILALVRSARPSQASNTSLAEQISWGPGPRASQALMLGVRARALLQGRLAPSLDDVTALARPVLQHRMALSFAARAEGVALSTIIEKLCNTVMTSETASSAA